MRVVPMGAWLALAAGCSVFRPPAEHPSPPDLTFHQLQLDEYRDGIRTSRSSYQQLTYVRGQGSVAAQGIVFTPTTGPESGGRLQAAKGEGTLKSASAFLHGGVAYDAPGGDHIETSACTANFTRHEITGTRPVQLRGAGYHVQAAAFESTFARPAEIHLHGDVHALVDPGQDAPMAPAKVRQASTP